MKREKSAFMQRTLGRVALRADDAPKSPVVVPAARQVLEHARPARRRCRVCAREQLIQDVQTAEEGERIHCTVQKTCVCLSKGISREHAGGLLEAEDV